MKTKLVTCCARPAEREFEEGFGRLRRWCAGAGSTFQRWPHRMNCSIVSPVEESLTNEPWGNRGKASGGQSSQGAWVEARISIAPTVAWRASREVRPWGDPSGGGSGRCDLSRLRCYEWVLGC